MNFVLSFILALLMSFPLGFEAMGSTLNNENAAQFSLNRGSGFSNYKLGTKIIREQIRDLIVQYDFSKDGGAISSKLVLRGPGDGSGGPGSGGTTSTGLPKGAIVVGCFIDVITAGTTSASGTMSLSTGQAAGDLKAATAAASYTGIVACIPVMTAAAAIKLTADSVPYAVIATGALTAGKWNVHILYTLSDY